MASSLPSDHKAKIIDGKAIAQTIRSEIASEVSHLSQKYGKVSLSLCVYESACVRVGEPGGMDVCD